MVMQYSYAGFFRILDRVSKAVHEQAAAAKVQPC
jgi:hypothetical protein